METKYYVVKSGKTILVQFPCNDRALALRLASQYNVVFGSGVDVFVDGSRIASNLHTGTLDAAINDATPSQCTP